MQLFGTIDKTATVQASKKKNEAELSRAKGILEKAKLDIANKKAALQHSLESIEMQTSVKIDSLKAQEQEALSGLEATKKRLKETAEELNPISKSLSNTVELLTKAQEALVDALDKADKTASENEALSKELVEKQNTLEERTVFITTKTQAALEGVKRIEEQEETLLEKIALAETAFSRFSLKERELNTVILQEKQNIEAKLLLITQRVKEAEKAEKALKNERRLLKTVQKLYGSTR